MVQALLLESCAALVLDSSSAMRAALFSSRMARSASTLRIFSSSMVLYSSSESFVIGLHLEVNQPLCFLGEFSDPDHLLDAN